LANQTGWGIASVFKGIGISAEALDRIRFGRGVIGRVTFVALAVFAILGIVADRVSGNYFLIGIGAAAAVLFLVFLFKVLDFAKKNPAIAVLDGAELITWRQLDLAAKGIPNPPAAVSLPDPDALLAIPPPLPQDPEE
jgi:hypothetical protein